MALQMSGKLPEISLLPLLHLGVRRRARLRNGPIGGGDLSRRMKTAKARCQTSLLHSTAGSSSNIPADTRQ